MIRHQTIRRAQQSLARSGVEQHFSKRGVKLFVQPAAAPVRDGKRPVNYCVALIVFAREAREIERAIEVRFVHGDWAIVAADVRRLKLKCPNGNEPRYLGCYP
jgi:hypothetical protein